ncbi:MAG: hypothetical protein ABSF83_04705 [Nitrososphaerales archaeon]|jgi:hypothetical protein
MGLLASALPGAVLYGYYLLSAAALAVPTFFIVQETLEIAGILGVKETRALWYLVATPSFLFMVLLNWYVIGVFFMVYGLRKFLQGSYRWSGFLLGLSAASNLVTAVPALGMLMSLRDRRDAVAFVLAALGCFLAINAPFFAVNPGLWLSFWRYESSWYIEGSWMLALLGSYSPLRHYIFPISFVLLCALIFWLSRRRGLTDVVSLTWLTTFAFFASTYVFTPQMQLVLLPFFVLTPIAKRYWEFLAFDILNSLFIVLAFSEVLLPFGISYSFGVSAYGDPVRWLAIVRSLWVVKFLAVDGLLPFAPGRVQRLAVSLRLLPRGGPTMPLPASPPSSAEEGGPEPRAGATSLKYVRSTRHSGASDGDQQR